MEVKVGPASVKFPPPSLLLQEGTGQDSSYNHRHVRPSCSTFLQVFSPRDRNNAGREHFTVLINTDLSTSPGLLAGLIPTQGLSSLADRLCVPTKEPGPSVS